MFSDPIVTNSSACSSIATASPSRCPLCHSTPWSCQANRGAHSPQRGRSVHIGQRASGAPPPAPMTFIRWPPGSLWAEQPLFAS